MSAYVVVEATVRDQGARDRYNSPAYQALLDIRDAALDCRFRLIG
jgi:uncharacterized protein (DUF1330 family)